MEEGREIPRSAVPPKGSVNNWLSVVYSGPIYGVVSVSLTLSHSHGFHSVRYSARPWRGPVRGGEHISPPQGIAPCNLPLARIELSICWQAITSCLMEEGQEIPRSAVPPKGSVNNWLSVVYSGPIYGVVSVSLTKSLYGQIHILLATEAWRALCAVSPSSLWVLMLLVVPRPTSKINKSLYGQIHILLATEVWRALALHAISSSSSSWLVPRTTISNISFTDRYTYVLSDLFNSSQRLSR